MAAQDDVQAAFESAQPAGDAAAEEPAGAHPAGAHRALEAADLAAWLDGYMASSLERAEIAGAVVSVVKDGELLFSRGYGLADVEAEKTMDPARTLVRVGSTSKLFTWIAVMQLMEQGKLELDRDVNDYLDFRLPERDGPPVTIDDLMNHRGGFEEGLREVLVSDPERYISTEQYLKENLRPRVFPAGDVPAYSNYGTALAGYIVERVSGEDYDDYVERHILEPLGMAQSTFRQPLPESMEGDLSRGYMTRDMPPRAFEFVTTAPAGSLTTTAGDMARFMIANLQEGRFRSQRILQADTARHMLRSTVTAPPGFAVMAHGFFDARENGRRIVGHGGDTVVFHTDMNLLPDEGVGFFVSFNSRGKQDAVYALRSGLLSDFLDRYFPAPEREPDPPAIAGAAEHAEALAGHYQSSRRIETAFLKLLYLFQQENIEANADGTLSLGSKPGRRYREVSPGLWREEGGEHALYVTEVNGHRTILDSANPTAVLHAVPLWEDAALNQSLLFGALLVLLVVLCAWPIGWYYRRRYRQPPHLAGAQLAGYRLVRLAVLADLLYLAGWFVAFKPLLGNQLEAYGPGLDPLLRVLQYAGLVPLVAAALGLWNLWLSLRSGRGRVARLGGLVLALALLGVLWIAWVGKLMTFNLAY